jgi:hypothetical protein
MYSAPAVSYPVRRSRAHLYVIAGLWMTGLCVWLFWLYGVDVTGWRQGFTFTVLVMTGAAALRTWWRMPTGELRWDLSNWIWVDANSVISGTLAVHLDFQKFLLLKYSGAGVEPRWLLLERRTSPVQWMPLRRAVYAHPRTKGGTASTTLTVGAGLS